MEVMLTYLSIGDFSRATHMTVKTLRHYHRIGLLEPADVDPHTGYRRYTTEQIPTAQVIRRFRDLDMPLEEIHAVLAAPDLKTRNQRITAHLNRLEDELGRTQQAISSLRDLLALPPPVSSPALSCAAWKRHPRPRSARSSTPRTPCPGVRERSASCMRP
jgi:DNA-binding transcriptional MerR regulator